MKYFYTTLLLFISIIGFSQKEANIWYFGGQAGLNFNFNPPQYLTDGNVNHLEGNGSISDKFGNLMYYSDGEVIWNSKHQAIINGTGLLGGKSSTQASLFINHRKNEKYIYNFTTSMKSDSSPFYLNIILNDTLIIKNKKILKYVSEKLNAVNHQNNYDIWISTHSLMNDTFFFYLLRKDGILDCPVIEVRNPALLDIGENQGQIKFSSDGKFLSCNFIGIKKQTLIAKFNAERGNLYYGFVLDDIVSYASEFSPNSRYLYVSEFYSSLFQYDLNKFDFLSIKNSRNTILSDNIKGSFALQIGSDRRIYLANPNSRYLKAIQYPDSAGLKCQLKDSFVYLGGKKSSYGLPNFNQSYFYTPSIDYAYEQDCRTNTIAFEGKDTIKATSYKWVFSKGTKTDTKTTKDASYTFADTGKWQVKFIASNGNRIDTVTKTITIRPKLEQGFLGEDIKLCKALPLKLNAPKELHCIHWYNDTMAEIGKVDSINIIKQGTYYAKATNLSFCVEWDTIRIDTGVNKPKADFMANDVCEDSTVYFTILSKNAETYSWKFGDGGVSNTENPVHKYNIDGVTKTFNVKLISEFRGGCADSVTKQITINAKPKKGFAYTTSGQLVNFTAIETNASSYKWAWGDGESDTIITNSKTTHNYNKFPSGKYTACLRVTNLAGCVADSCREINISGGISSVALQNEIVIFPNPNKGRFTVNISKVGNYNLKVYNTTGQVVLEKTIKGNQPNTIFLNQPNGNYIIEITDDESNRVIKKIEIE